MVRMRPQQVATVLRRFAQGYRSCATWLDRSQERKGVVLWLQGIGQQAALRRFAQSAALIVGIGRSVRRFHFLSALALLSGLAACSQPSEDLAIAQACPSAGIVGEASSITIFRPGRGRDLTDVAAQGNLANLRAECAFARREVNVKLTIELQIAAGPANRDRSASLRYFVAIVNSDNNVVAREEYTVDTQFPPNQGRVVIAEEVEPRIPFRERVQVHRYRILVGFILTPEQLQNNRRRR